ncbi:hypothetical protein F2Q68_00035650 [Brassica cretica]|uniref:Uncharacterized protein n=1 Tax=Brassica cretica TaxID=69181 RepID=A0A8S9H0F4_BRACR|nr:hypothetical protein F2Q68_00035650 [Brassica cretica]
MTTMAKAYYSQKQVLTLHCRHTRPHESGLGGLTVGEEFSIPLQGPSNNKDSAHHRRPYDEDQLGGRIDRLKRSFDRLKRSFDRLKRSFDWLNFIPDQTIGLIATRHAFFRPKGPTSNRPEPLPLGRISLRAKGRKAHESYKRTLKGKQRQTLDIKI